MIERFFGTVMTHSGHLTYLMTVADISLSIFNAKSEEIGKMRLHGFLKHYADILTATRHFDES
jgi:hypothetical protein